MGTSPRKHRILGLLPLIVACATDRKDVGSFESSGAGDGSAEGEGGEASGSATGTSATGGTSATSSESGTSATSGSASGTSATSSASGTSTTSGTTAESGEGGPRLDVGPDSGEADSGPLEAGGEGCDKVDFLFIVDNSLSMSDEQQNLANSFPQFIETIQTEVVSDYHVMVIDTDPQDKWDEDLAECPGKCAGEPPTDPCGVVGAKTAWLCGSLPTPDPCDAALGGGIDHDDTVQRNSCNIAGGKRWIDDTQPDVAGTFACISDLYEGNSPEQTMAGMNTAIGPAMVGPGGCNEGFLRDDAVLVVTFISDEEDGPADSPGDPASWKADLLALKQGNQTAIVMLGLLGDTTLPGAVCPPDSMAGSNGGEYSPRLIEFVDSFGARGLWGSVCAPDYSPFFDQAVALIDSACDTFVPPG